MKTWETAKIDRKYEAYRLKDEKREKELLSSILERGIEDSLFGIEQHEHFILLDGFKRLRCATKLGIGIIPVTAHSGDECSGVIIFLKHTQRANITFFEEASLIDILKCEHHLTVSEIAGKLGKSPGWVSVRLGVLSRMPDSIRESILSGKFPYRAYLYTLRRFTRVKGISQKEIETFVHSVSGKQLSLRSIDRLASGYFGEDSTIRNELQAGKIEWVMEQLKENSSDKQSDFNPSEHRVLEELQRIDNLLRRLEYDLKDSRFQAERFFIQALLWIENIFQKIEPFMKTLKGFYDQRRAKTSHIANAS